MTFWPSTRYSDFHTDKTFHQFHDLDTELDLHRITGGFSWGICNGCGMPTGNAYTSRHLVSSLLGYAYAPIVETSFSELAGSFPRASDLFSTFYLEYTMTEYRTSGWEFGSWDNHHQYNLKQYEAQKHKAIYRQLGPIVKNPDHLEAWSFNVKTEGTLDGGISFQLEDPLG